MITERQKLILLAEKSDFGWKTVEEYTQHKLADDEADGKKIRRAEERAGTALKSATSKKSAKRAFSVSRPSTSLRLVRCVIRATACPYLVHPPFHKHPVIVLLAASLATEDLNALKLFVPRVLDPKVFQVTDDYWSTTKVSLTFHLLIPRVISLMMFPKIQAKKLETLRLKM